MGNGNTPLPQVAARPRANTLTRRGRVTRRSKTCPTEEEQEGEQEKQAKGATKKRAADVLKERQVRRTAIKTIPPCCPGPDGSLAGSGGQGQ